MATKRKTSKGHRAPESTADVLREQWRAALKALASAEAEMEKQWKQLVKKSGLSGKDAKGTLKELRVRLERERQRALKGIEAGVAGLQARVKEERAVLSRKADAVVKSALVAFNIPSRHEVGQLTRKVDELSRKIDSFRASPRRKSTQKAVRPAARRSSRTRA